MTPAEELAWRIVGREGGIKDVNDGKGVTRFGQTPQWLSDFGLTPPNTPAEAVNNYLIFFKKTGLDCVFISYLDDVADSVIDYAVQAGHIRAIKALQSALHLPADGVIGDKTRNAIRLVDRKQLAREIIAANMEFEGAIITADPGKYARNAKGWARRNADQVRKLQ